MADDVNNTASELSLGLKQLVQRYEPLSSVEIGEQLAQCNRQITPRRTQTGGYEFKERPRND